jgi:imidazolonepropionase-like amidohydrolase
MRFTAITTAALAALCFASGALAETIIVTAARMIDVLAGREVERPQLIITNDRIVSVGRQGDPAPAEARKMEAIQAATRNAAEALDQGADVGAIAPGRHADVIAMDGDPLQDIRRLETVAVVIKGGAIVKGNVQ